MSGITGNRYSAQQNATTNALNAKLEIKRRIPLPMSSTHINDIIYPVQTKKGLKWGKNHPGNSGGQTNQRVLNKVPQRLGLLLDGFLILFSCRVRLPHEAIKSKLSSKQIVDVIEEDLCYFQNLTHLDLADNKVRLEQLRNLKFLQELNLQFNSITMIPPLSDKDFTNLEVLNLSYNKFNFDSIRSLYSCTNLKQLDLAANNLEQLPDDMFQFQNLTDLNLSGNFFSSVPTFGSPAIIFKTLGSIKNLKRLNLSRNKFFKFHSEMLD